MELGASRGTAGQSGAVLAIMGSGETSPTMVEVHRRLVAGLGVDRPRAVLLAAPYGFQENAAEISTRARAYFARSAGIDVNVLAGSPQPGAELDADGQPDPDVEFGPELDPDAELAAIRAADWVFSGPGSPTCALRAWRDGPVGQALRDRVCQARGVTVLASAAAATAGLVALPVYEIYKAGIHPYWEDGLDLLGCLDLPVAVIPHYDNREGGTHDTRYCYLGERRLRLLEQQLPAGAAVLGVDEHTVAVLDLRAGMVDVRGRGAVTVRRAGRGTMLPTGATLSFAELRDLVRRPAAAGVPAAGAPAIPPPAPPTLTELASGAEQRFEAAGSRRDAGGMARAILDLEAAIRDWSADTEEDSGTDAARAVLRALVVRLGEMAAAGLVDPTERWRSLAESLLALRDQLRAERSYHAADAIRNALQAAGLQVYDTPEGARWSLPESRPPP